MVSIKNKFQVSKLNRVRLIAFFVFAISVVKAQDSTKVASAYFEGKVTYLYQILNPNNKLISDEEFYQDIPNGGKSTVILYIRGNQYRWEYEDRVEIYLPQTQQIAIYSKKKLDSVYYAPASIAEEPMIKMEKLAETKRLQHYDLTAHAVLTKWETRTYLYNPSVLKTNPNFWKNHLRNYLGNFIQKSSCFPLMIVQKSTLGNWAMAMTKIEHEKISDEVFVLPKK